MVMKLVKFSQFHMGGGGITLSNGKTSECRSSRSFIFKDKKIACFGSYQK